MLFLCRFFHWLSYSPAYATHSTKTRLDHTQAHTHTDKLPWTKSLLTDISKRVNEKRMILLLLLHVWVLAPQILHALFQFRRCLLVSNPLSMCEHLYYGRKNDKGPHATMPCHRMYHSTMIDILTFFRIILLLIKEIYLNGSIKALKSKLQNI